MKVIDVSYHNGNIDFNKVRQDGVEGVIIRVGYGKGNTDLKFKEYIQQSIKTGLHIGIYYFSYAYTVQMAVTEALYCMKLIEPFRQYIDLPVFFDWEYDSMKYAQKHGVNPGKELITEMTSAFCQAIYNARYMPGYYLNKDYAKNYVDESKLRSYKRWFARYTDVPQNDCYLWQYSSKGTVKGISGNVDMDILNVDITKQKSDDEIVMEVIKGYWGSGNDRRQRLTEAGYNYSHIQDLVNKAMKQLEKEKENGK